MKSNPFESNAMKTFKTTNNQPNQVPLPTNQINQNNQPNFSTSPVPIPTSFSSSTKAVPLPTIPTQKTNASPIIVSTQPIASIPIIDGSTMIPIKKVSPNHHEQRKNVTKPICDGLFISESPKIVTIPISPVSQTIDVENVKKNVVELFQSLIVDENHKERNYFLNFEYENVLKRIENCQIEKEKVEKEMKRSTTKRSQMKEKEDEITRINSEMNNEIINKNNLEKVKKSIIQAQNSVVLPAIDVVLIVLDALQNGQKIISNEDGKMNEIFEKIENEVLSIPFRLRKVVNRVKKCMTHVLSEKDQMNKKSYFSLDFSVFYGAIIGQDNGLIINDMFGRPIGNSGMLSTIETFHKRLIDEGLETRVTGKALKEFMAKKMDKGWVNKNAFLKSKKLNKALVEFIVSLRNLFRGDFKDLKQNQKELKELSEGDIIKIQYMEFLSIANLLLENIETYLQHLHLVVLQSEKKVEFLTDKEAIDLYKEITDKNFVPKMKIEKEIITDTNIAFNSKHKIIRTIIHYASLNRIIEFLTTPKGVNDRRFTQTFFTSVEVISSYQEVIDLLITRYNVPLRMKKVEFDENKREEIQEYVKVQLINLIDLALDSIPICVLERLIQQLQSNQIKLIDENNTNYEYKILAHIEQRKYILSSYSKAQIELKFTEKQLSPIFMFLQSSPRVLAEQISVNDLKTIIEIDSYEFEAVTYEDFYSICPNIKEMLNRNNNGSHWVRTIYNYCSKFVYKKMIADKFVETIAYLKELQNYHSSFVLCVGLTTVLPSQPPKGEYHDMFEKCVKEQKLNELRNSNTLNEYVKESRISGIEKVQILVDIRHQIEYIQNEIRELSRSPSITNEIFNKDSMHISIIPWSPFSKTLFDLNEKQERTINTRFGKLINVDRANGFDALVRKMKVIVSRIKQNQFFRYNPEEGLFDYMDQYPHFTSK